MTVPYGNSYDWNTGFGNNSSTSSNLLGINTDNSLYIPPASDMDIINKPYSGGNFFDQYLTDLGKYIKNNPLVPLQAVGNIWNAYTGYKNSKNALALARDNYNLQKQAYEANEARAKEAFNWQRQDRLSHQL